MVCVLCVCVFECVCVCVCLPYHILGLALTAVPPLLPPPALNTEHSPLQGLQRQGLATRADPSPLDSTHSLRV